MTTDLQTIYKDVFSVKKGHRINNFHRYFGYDDEKDFQKKIDLLYKNYLEVNDSYEYDPDIYATTVRDTIRAYTRNKDALIDVYKKFSDYLVEKGLEVVVEFPPIPISNTFERLMFIAKYLQDDGAQISDLEDILLQSKRTIDDDLAKLRGLDDDPLQVCGQRFVVEDTERSMGKMAFASTVHPFFLTCNLTQIIIMLEGLREQAKRPEFEAYAMSLAKNVWRQLSSYAKERIFYIFDELWTGEKEWYHSIDTAGNNLYYTERACSTIGDNVFMECYKSGGRRKCVIEYKIDGGTVFYKNVTIKHYNYETAVIEVEGKEMTIRMDCLLRSSYYADTMF